MNISADVIEAFLKKVDGSFPVPLSQKQNLHSFAMKLCEKATLCAHFESEEIVSLVAGYTENLTDNLAYISIVATVRDYMGKGLAKKLVCEFIDICKIKNIDAVHLYAVRENSAAVKMYESIGFEEWKCRDEMRPEDVHFIYYIGKERDLK